MEWRNSGSCGAGAYSVGLCIGGGKVVVERMIEDMAKALWRLDNPYEDGFSEAAPNDWEKWPETGRQASLAYVDHSKEDYREQARTAFQASGAININEMLTQAEEILGVPNQYLEWFAWPEMFGSTAGPRGGMGGQMMTSFQVFGFREAGMQEGVMCCVGVWRKWNGEMGEVWR